MNVMLHKDRRKWQQAEELSSPPRQDKHNTEMIKIADRAHAQNANFIQYKYNHQIAGIS